MPFLCQTKSLGLTCRLVVAILAFHHYLDQPAGRADDRRSKKGAGKRP